MALRYNIKQAVDKPKGARVLVPIIEPSIGLERAYLAELNRLLQACARAYRDVVLPAYQQRSLGDAMATWMTDVDSTTFGRFASLVNALRLGVFERISTLLGLEAKRHTEQWLRNAKKAFGIDLKGVVDSEGLNSYLEAAALRNASLITGLTDDLVRRVSQDVLASMIAGESAAQLRPRIARSFGFSANRAKVIARDQTSKLTSDLTRKRHEEAGIEEYIWRTSQDERVRERHRNLAGRKYKYGEPTGAEEGLPPGQPIMCRCTAQAVVEF